MNPDKEIELFNYVNSLIGQPFEFGKNDCPLLAAGALDVMAGTSHREELEGLWDSKASAWRYMKENGTIYDNLVAKGCKEVAFTHLQTGDFICMEQKLAHEKKWHSVGIYLGGRVVIMTDETGVEFVKRSQVPNATKVLRWA